MNFFRHIGRYFTLLTRVFSWPEKFKIFFKQLFIEIDSIGIQSLGIVAIVSVFMGAVVVIQTASNIDSPLIPSYLIGFTSRQSVILEFSSTIMCLILAGKVGSRIASELGTMRVTEQIDALDIMGINSASFLIMPKIFAALIIMPFITILSMGISIFGGFLAGTLTDIITYSDFIQGLQTDFKPFHVYYSLLKVEFFAFAITSISAYHGYFAYGGALDVGKASTTAVVYSSITILVINLVLTQLILT